MCSDVPYPSVLRLSLRLPGGAPGDGRVRGSNPEQRDKLSQAWADKNRPGEVCGMASFDPSALPLGIKQVFIAIIEGAQATELDPVVCSTRLKELKAAVNEAQTEVFKAYLEATPGRDGIRRRAVMELLAQCQIITMDEQFRLVQKWDELAKTLSRHLRKNPLLIPSKCDFSLELGHY
jgi:hypothetical protein